jgi:VIT1/CCC1 family predicted Fe2+/Mn2+ transporter
MGIKKYMEKRIRGWLPKEPNLPSSKVKMADAKTKVTKPRWWKPLWITALFIVIIFGVVNYFLLHYPLSSVIGGIAISLLGIGAAYYIRVRPSVKVNRVVYICLGLGIGWVAWVIYAITGIGRLVTDTLGVWPSLIISFAVFYTIGALIGDWIGKRRNYQLPLSP